MDASLTPVPMETSETNIHTDEQNLSTWQFAIMRYQDGPSGRTRLR